MGAESSTMVNDSVAARTLEGRSIDAVAKYIKEKNVRRIVVMTGAGISTSAGIPDFRSPETGLYANLARLNLPYPEAVFDISYFRKNPRPFYALAHEIYPGKFRPTITHSFIKLLYDKGRLLKLFTQNIDCLEREAGLPGEMVVEAHGSFASHACIDCKTAYADELMRKAVDANDVPLCTECMGLVKPNIVFFGESLPSDFFLNRTLPAAADLCIVMGTSLTVQPFASLPSLCREETPRVLINLEQAGSLGSRPDDVLILGDCDEGVRKLADALGWLEDLEALWAQTKPEDEGPQEKGEEKEKSKDETLQEEVERLTEEVEATLNISQAHEERTRSQLGSPAEKQEAEEGAASKPKQPEEDPEPEPQRPTEGADKKDDASSATKDDQNKAESPSPESLEDAEAKKKADSTL